MKLLRRRLDESSDTTISTDVTEHCTLYQVITESIGENGEHIEEKDVVCVDDNDTDIVSKSRTNLFRADSLILNPNPFSIGICCE